MSRVVHSAGLGSLQATSKQSVRVEAELWLVRFSAALTRGGGALVPCKTPEAPVRVPLWT